MEIEIVVDSSSDYELDDLNSKNIKLIPLQITFGNESFLDIVELAKEDFWNKLLSREYYPKTAQPSPQTFIDMFENAKLNNSAVILICLSSQLSGLYNTAIMAKDMVDYEHVYVIDSRTACVGIKLLADEAARLRDLGASPKEIVEKIESLKSRIVLRAALDTLDYLQMGGRISKVAANIGTLAKLKPIITVTKEGAVAVHSKCIGIKKAMIELAKTFVEIPMDENFPILPLFSYDKSNGIAMCEKLKASGIPVNSDALLNIGAVIGSHVGDKGFGFFYVAKE